MTLAYDLLSKNSRRPHRLIFGEWTSETMRVQTDRQGDKMSNVYTTICERWFGVRSEGVGVRDKKVETLQLIVVSLEGEQANHSSNPNNTWLMASMEFQLLISGRKL